MNNTSAFQIQAVTASGGAAYYVVFNFTPGTAAEEAVPCTRCGFFVFLFSYQELLT